MVQEKKTLDQLEGDLRDIVGALDIDALRGELEVLQAQMSAPDFWSNQMSAKRVAQKAADMEKEITQANDAQRELAELRELEAMQDDAEMKAEFETRLNDFQKHLDALSRQTFLSGEHDAFDALLSVHAGAGGADAADWAEMLSRMFIRYAERHDWQVEVIDESRNEEGGVKRMTMAIRGRFAYGNLKSEAGVHRLVRISPFDAEKMRHTSFALVEVIPELDDVSEQSIVIPDGDLRIDTFASSGAGGQSVNTSNSAVRITHLPTSTVVSVQNERSQQQNRETAMRILKSRLYQLMLAQQKEKIDELRGEHVKAEWGSQIRSYVLHPYKMVKDHRTGAETSDVDAVLGGDLDFLIEAFLRQV